MKNLKTLLIKNLNVKIETHFIVFEFSKQFTYEDYEKVFSPVINSFDISILVNNIGKAFPALFKKLTILQTKQMIDINITSQVLLTKCFQIK